MSKWWNCHLFGKLIKFLLLQLHHACNVNKKNSYSFCLLKKNLGFTAFIHFDSIIFFILENYISNVIIQITIYYFQ